MGRCTVICVTCFVYLAGMLGRAGMSRADEKDSAKGLDFFEKKIRPVLAAQCYECHSAEALTRVSGKALAAGF